MGLILRVTSRKYFNQHKNSAGFNLNLGDYTTNLTAIVMDYCKAEFVLEVGWNSIATATNYWNISSRGGIAYEIARVTGSFITEGWATGNTFDFFTTYAAAPVLYCTGIVTFISDDGSYMFVTATATLVGYGTDNAMMARADSSANYLNSLMYKPNLIENDATFSTISLQSGADNAWYTDNARSLTPVVMASQGVNKSFVTGTVEVNYEGDVATYFQSFKIAHTFIVAPYYLDGDDFVAVPDYLAGTNSLKYVFLTDFRSILSDLSSSKKLTFENNKGAVGYFNETITGGNPIYTLDSVAFGNTYDTLTIELPTTVTFTVDGTFNANTKYIVYFSYLPTIAEYTSNALFADTFIYKAQANFLNVTTTYPGQLISALSSSVVLGQMVVLATFDFDLATQALLSTDKSFVISIEVGNETVLSNASDRVNLFAASKAFASITSNNGLFLLNSVQFTDYDGVQDVTATAWNEDGFRVEFDFDLDLNKEAVLESLQVDLVAFNTVTEQYFSLDSYVYNLGNIISGGVQQINVNTTRGYLIDSLQFNEISLNTGANALGFQNYVGVIAQKINWLAWKRNADADTVFFNSAKPQNNLNYLSSNYSDLNNYEIKMLFKAVCSGLNQFGLPSVQTYRLESGSFTIYDYDKDGNVVPKIVPTIETFVASTLQSLDGNISADVPTLFRITWVLDVPIFSTVGSSCVHRIEQTGQLGTSIFELSSFDADIDILNNLLMPIAGEDFVRMTTSGGNLITECIIDNTKIKPNTSYNLSGRVTNI